jgi:hypothetical protein
MAHIAIDLETLGTVPGSVVLSIGAVIFDPAKPPSECLGEELYCVIDKADSVAKGLTIDADTLKWWEKQSPAARQVLADAEDEAKADSLADALLFLSRFISPKSTIWTNGANFDQPLLAVAYAKAEMKLPWDYWNGKCHRTLVNLHSNPKQFLVNKMAHNALEDAKAQAVQLVSVVQALKLKL